MRRKRIRVVIEFLNIPRKTPSANNVNRGGTYKKRGVRRSSRRPLSILPRSPRRTLAHYVLPNSPYYRQPLIFQLLFYQPWDTLRSPRSGLPCPSPPRHQERRFNIHCRVHTAGRGTDWWRRTHSPNQVPNPPSLFPLNHLEFDGFCLLHHLSLPMWPLRSLSPIISTFVHSLSRDC